MHNIFNNRLNVNTFTNSNNNGFFNNNSNSSNNNNSNNSRFFRNTFTNSNNDIGFFNNSNNNIIPILLPASLMSQPCRPVEQVVPHLLQAPRRLNLRGEACGPARRSVPVYIFSRALW
ncbi:unnamed protein product [Polarella glacialis]|uniref:Uncharacterized protein n=1 Tax=Polarella glacialis TaxID=89957 RepID=A0A813LRC7_POLGL|nr:unnamed protein product [Polarella glacialis]CAE8733011.1 unnamed protein product [Polarella glacialis]